MDLLMELNNVRAFSVGCEIKKKKKKRFNNGSAH